MSKLRSLKIFSDFAPSRFKLENFGSSSDVPLNHCSFSQTGVDVNGEDMFVC